MKKRVAAAVTGTLLTISAIAAAPWIAERYAASKVDDALEQIRTRATAVAHRGSVSVDIWTRTVVVRDVSLDMPGENGSKARIARVTIERPSTSNGRVAAARVRIDNVAVRTGDETTTIPAIEVTGYDGPAEGLAGAAPSGKAVRTQADVMETVSFAGAAVPSIEVHNERLGAFRRATGVVFGRMSDGVVSRASVSGADLNVAERAARDGTSRGGFSLSTGAVEAFDLSLPAALRFQASDGAGERERLFASALITRLNVATPTDRLGLVTASAKTLQIDDLRLRALAFTPEALAEMNVRRLSDDPPTPADLRQRLMLLTDLVRAFAVAKVTASDLSWSVAPADGRWRSGAAALIEISSVADGRAASALARNASSESDLGRAMVEKAEVQRVDASGLLAYAERLGRDQGLLTTTPPPDEVVKLFPRVGRAEIAGARVTAIDGAFYSVGSIRTGQRSEAEALPNKAGLVIESLNVPVPKEGLVAPYLAEAGLERLNVDLRLIASLDATTKTLTLDALDYASPGIADARLTGSLTNVDPTLAVATGGEFIQKLSEVTLQPFELHVLDRGGVEAALSTAAQAAKRPKDVFADALSDDLKVRLTDALGPSAEPSATALALFLRDGGALDVTISPRAPDTRLLDLLSVIKLGPKGWAQALDLTVVARASAEPQPVVAP